MSRTSPSPRWKMAMLAIASLMVMAYIDYTTGYELVFSAAYLIPVSLCAWHFGLRTVLLMSIASGVVSGLMDINHPYSHYMFQFLNGFTCFLISILTGLLLHRFKRTLEERKQANNDLQKALEELKRSTEEIGKLQSGLQVVCAWTNRIKVGDQWMTPDEFLSTQLHLNLTHGMSPEAYREFEQDIERKAQAEAANLPQDRQWQGRR